MPPPSAPEMSISRKVFHSDNLFSGHFAHASVRKRPARYCLKSFRLRNNTGAIHTYIYIYLLLSALTLKCLIHMCIPCTFDQAKEARELTKLVGETTRTRNDHKSKFHFRMVLYQVTSRVFISQSRESERGGQEKKEGRNFPPYPLSLR